MRAKSNVNTSHLIHSYISKTFIFLCLLAMLSGCFQSDDSAGITDFSVTPTTLSTEIILPTPLATRPAYQPGELVDYICQTGDTLPALAAHFNTTVQEIRDVNAVLPKDVTTLPPGLPLKIPIYYQALWGTSFQMVPDGLFINGPAQIDFDLEAFVASMPGWLKNYRTWVGNEWRSGGGLMDYIGTNYSISPRILLAIVEYQAGGLTQPTMTVSEASPLGLNDRNRVGLAQELIYIANYLNNGYYGWRTGNLLSIEHKNGQIEYPDPWQNAATVGLQYYFASVLDSTSYQLAVSGQGYSKTYAALFGDPWVINVDHIPGSLTQPEMNLPFELNKSWAFTGGPHTGWGEGDPWAAIDFAPPSVVGGCSPTDEWATAVADGVIARKANAIAVLDLDGDMDERTGWVVFYLHLSTDSIPAQGTVVKKGDLIGHPSCEGGRSTGTHVHIARKYNGEWIAADGALPFNLEGWIAKNGTEAYQGTMTRFSHSVRACICSDIESQLQSGK